jgi:hypothetical protein
MSASSSVKPAKDDIVAIFLLMVWFAITNDSFFHDPGDRNRMRKQLRHRRRSCAPCMDTHAHN